MAQTIPAFNCRFTRQVDPQLQCSICYSTMLKPVSLGCGHSGCRECLTELVTKTLMPKCPMCRTELRADSICVNIALDHVTSELAVECLSVGCGWKGSYGQAPEHFKTCPKLQVVCNNEECQHKSIREEMPNHIASCSKKKIPCSECHVCVKWELLQKHQAEQCPNAVIQCPLDCGSTIPRSSITLHLHQCPEKVYLCKVPGCKKMIKRKDLTSHIMEAASSHYVLQLSEIKRLRRIIHNLCFQAGEDNRGIIVVLLNTKITNEAKRGAILRVLHKLETAEGRNWLFWVSSTWSSDGTKVIDLYGGDQKQDRLLFLAPSAGRNATLLGEISDTDTESNQIDSMLQKVIERAELRIMGQRQQREQRARWRAERAKQEKELQESERSDRREPPNQIHDLSQQTEQAHWGGETVQQVKELREPELSTREPIIEQQKEEKIRKAREQRLTEEPVSGIKIIIRTSDGERMERLFKDTAFFQEVYDWVGSSNRMPLYFTIQRGSTVVKHTERLQSNEVLDISERDEDEMKVTLNNSEVSFLGQFQDSKEDLSETINDASSCQPHPITASYKTASVESAAQLVLPCCTASSGKSTFGAADSSQAKAQVKRKRKDNRTRKYKREKRKQDDNN